ncbi:hypothetical protein R1flu_016587 [Riccia fluitans]|uniref:Oxidoreductase n=1 Tax=Riccia fluitans TaxID=41844 RepID=A0ABD1YM98_9MARC
MTDAVKVGLIGYGMAGQVFHAPVIEAVPQLKLVKVLERRTNLSPQRYPWVKVVRDISEMLEDEEIELVVIATPNSSHFDYTQQALKANKHVVVDKPFTVTSVEAKLLIDLAEERKLVLSVFQNRRWDGDFLTVQKVLDGKLLGRVVEYEAHFDRFRNFQKQNWREEAEEPGSGILYDLGSHLIDQALVLFGTPEMVTADIRKQRDGSKVDDNFEILMQYPELKVTLKAGMLVKIPGPRYIVQGTEGSFHKHGIDPQEDALKMGRTPAEFGWGVSSKEDRGHLVTRIANLEIDARVETLPGSYQEYYSNIADAIRGKMELAVKPVTAMQTIRIIELAMESNMLKRSIAMLD